MKVAITADTHLSTRLAYPERYNALENILQQIESENIGILVIAGDLFDKDFRNPAELENLCRKYPWIQLHIIPGNHDIAISEKSIVGANIHVHTSPDAVEFESATFLFIPYEEKTNMYERMDSALRKIQPKEWILIGHGDYYGGIKEVNPLEPGTYMPLSEKNVAALNPRAVFLGHIHKPISQGKVYYPGSPCGLDISETGKRRFLVYDTEDGSVTSRNVETDIIYFEESFVIVPSDKEVALLKEEISRRIGSWVIGPGEQSRVVVRVKAAGYATDRRAISAALREGFDKFSYYKGEGLSIDGLSVSTDRQLGAIAVRTMKLIDELDWNFGNDEPDKELLKIEALQVIYGV